MQRLQLIEVTNLHLLPNHSKAVGIEVIDRSSSWCLSVSWCYLHLKERMKIEACCLG